MHALPARPLKVQGGRGSDTYADGMESTFFILAILGFYLVGVGAIDDPLLSRGEHCSPVKINFSFIVLFTDEKYQKSARRTRAVLLANLRRRARVSRANRAWQVLAANGKAKVGSLTLSALSPIPRERTYHTREPSRFVHALSARPHIKVGIDRFAKRTRSASPRQGKRAWI